MNKEKIQKEIARRNEIWKAASPAEKRVLLAKDVIAQVKAKKYIPEQGNWLVIDKKYEANESIQEKILEGDVCECCALGGLMASKIAFCNRVKGKDTDGYSKFVLDRDNEKFKLGGIFSKSQLRIIELTFEGGGGIEEFNYDDDGEIVKSEKKYEAFYYKYRNSDDRMIAIMQNIVDNNGQFKI